MSKIKKIIIGIIGILIIVFIAFIVWAWTTPNNTTNS